MAMIRILQYPDPKLRRVSVPVEKITPEVKQIIDDMFETLFNTENCAALAATQLDLEIPYRITVINILPDEYPPLCLVNGDIYERWGEKISEREGCMSVPDTWEYIARLEHIKVRYMDQHGEQHDIQAEGYMSRCIQHELDHLDGKLNIHHLPKMKMARVEKNIKQFHRRKKKKK